MATKHPPRGTREVWMVWILAFLPLTLAITTNVTDDDLEIMNKFNKPYVQSIQSPDGDIIDCVPFHLQPAFDNLLNQNVTFEMVRASILRRQISGNYSSSIKPLAQLWHTNGRCPERTVPIRRKTMEDVLMAKSIKSTGKRIPGNYPNPDSTSDGQTNDDDDKHETANLNSNEAGWQVYLLLYRDTRTRLFGFYTKDNYRTYCYNLDCNGFVQYSNSITLGGVISLISTYGVVQHEITMLIYKGLKSIMATKNLRREAGKVLDLRIFWVLSFLPLALTMPVRVSSHDFDVADHLKNLNKPYVKFIKSPCGDIIDCVSINHQPAFDNPLLRNHTIQMQPSFYPEELSKKLSSHENSSSNEELLTQLWHSNGRCPDGTIPIRRISDEDFRKASSLQRFGRKTPKTFPNPKSPPSAITNAEYHEYVVQSVDKAKFYGAKAGINVWNPRVESGEFSLAQIWLAAGDYNVDLNTIEAGWQVYSDLFGDNRTRLFIYWTRDSYRKTGCYNLLCSAFVQTDGGLALGAAISPVSSYNGNQNHLSLLVFKDPKSGNWWLQIGKKSIGYWPATLFTHLRDSAEAVTWGGEIVNTVVGGKHTTTEMGSGRFPVDGTKKAANFINLQIMDESNSLKTPESFNSMATKPGCYDITSGKNDEWGEFFFFGGPGRNEGCH